MTLLLGVGTAVGQTQEQKLVDRLLRPDTSMVNRAQEKQFVGGGSLSVDRRIRGRTFYSRGKTLTKPFSGERSLTPQHFDARKFRMGNSQANLAPRTGFAQKDRIISPPPAPRIRVAPESNATVAVREFSGHRAFPIRGKSQKALQAYNRPLTIEQVRELLNKSK